MTTLDATVQQAITEAELDEEMEALIADRPQYQEFVPGVNADAESGKGRAVVSTAAELTIYNRETGEPSQVIFDALRARMGQRFPEDHPNPKFAGQRVYTRKESEAPKPTRGKLSCPLNYNKPTKEALDMGYGTGARGCRKPAYFLTEEDVNLHVEKNHKRYWAQKVAAKAKRERDEMMELQRQTLQAMQAMGKTKAGS